MCFWNYECFSEELLLFQRSFFFNLEDLCCVERRGTGLNWLVVDLSPAVLRDSRD